MVYVLKSVSNMATAASTAARVAAATEYLRDDAVNAIAAAAAVAVFEVSPLKAPAAAALAAKREGGSDAVATAVAAGVAAAAVGWDGATIETISSEAATTVKTFDVRNDGVMYAAEQVAEKVRAVSFPSRYPAVEAAAAAAYAAFLTERRGDRPFPWGPIDAAAAAEDAAAAAAAAAGAAAAAAAADAYSDLSYDSASYAATAAARAATNRGAPKNAAVAAATRALRLQLKSDANSTRMDAAIAAAAAAASAVTDSAPVPVRIGTFGAEGYFEVMPDCHEITKGKLNTIMEVDTFLAGFLLFSLTGQKESETEVTEDEKVQAKVDKLAADLAGELEAMKQLTVTQDEYDAMEKEVASMTKELEVMGIEIEAKENLEAELRRSTEALAALEAEREEQRRMADLASKVEVPSGAPRIRDWFVEREGVILKACDRLGVSSSTSDLPSEEPRMVGLAGPSGAGKSTVASMVVRREDVRAAFHKGVLWLQVGQGAKDRLTELMNRLAGMVYETVMQKSCRPPRKQGIDNDPEDGAAYIREVVDESSIRFLVVVDDVWEVEVLEAHRKAGVWVLYTTREHGLLPEAIPLRLDQVREEEAELVLRRAADLKDDARLPNAAYELMARCDFMMLDLVLVGRWGKVRRRSSERAWKTALDHIEKAQEGDEGGQPLSWRAALLRGGLEELACDNSQNKELYLALAVIPKGVAFPSEVPAVLLYGEELTAEELEAAGLVTATLECWSILALDAGGMYRVHDEHADFIQGRFAANHDVQNTALPRWRVYISSVQALLSFSGMSLVEIWDLQAQIGGESVPSRPYGEALASMDPSSADLSTALQAAKHFDSCWKIYKTLRYTRELVETAKINNQDLAVLQELCDVVIKRFFIRERCAEYSAGIEEALQRLQKHMDGAREVAQLCNERVNQILPGRNISRDIAAVKQNVLDFATTINVALTHELHEKLDAMAARLADQMHAHTVDEAARAATALSYAREMLASAATLFREVPLAGQICATFLAFEELVDTAKSNKEDLAVLRELCDVVIKSFLMRERRAEYSAGIEEARQHLMKHMDAAREVAQLCNGRVKQRLLGRKISRDIASVKQGLLDFSTTINVALTHELREKLDVNATRLADQEEYMPSSAQVAGAPRLRDWYVERENLMTEVCDRLGVGSSTDAFQEPQMVGLAGPGGTGKSTVASMVVARGDVRTSFYKGVLWLPGAQDVRDRAIALGVPRAQADRVWAATFHSFAATVLKQNRHLVWAESSPTSSSHASQLDIIGHAEQVGLVGKLLADPYRDEWDSRDDLAAPFYGGEQAFEGSWLSGGGSWGMPPTKEEQGQEAARQRKESETRAKVVLARITLWKEQGMTVDAVRLRDVDVDDHTDTAAAHIYAPYQQHLRDRRQVDFGDLCMMATDLFTRHPEVLERYRWRLRHILVDEYQDTSPAQQRLLQALVKGVPSARSAARHNPTSESTPSSTSTPASAASPEIGAGKGAGAAEGLEKHPGLGVSLFCAGDEDQHIYGWRGTTVDHLHRFEEDFPGAVRCALTETHRLPVHLLRSATGLMRAGGLVPLLNRRMRTKQRSPGAVVRAQGLWNSREEGKWVSMEACKINREQGISYKDMAVIARTAYNTRELEESLAARGIPYTVEGGSSFFSRPEVQAPLALLALCANPQDDAAFRQFFALRSQTRLLDWATPAAMRGIGELAVAEGVSFAEGVRLCVSRGHVKEEEASIFIYGLRRWSSLLMGWHKLHETERGAAVWRIFWEAGFLPRPADASFASLGGMSRGAVPDSKITKDQETVIQLAAAASRCDHVGRFLLRATRAREETANQQAAREKSGGRGGRWEGITGGQIKHESQQSSEDSLEMMTMHQAKGREFKVVFLTGWDEGSFPLLPNSGDGDHMVESLERVQEERRLGYVALTRASKNAIITFSKKRRFRNAWINSAGPSRFLLEMPTEYVEVQPDAIGRILNDYPGMAGSHRLAFDGLVQAGKLRRSRPVLGKLDTSFGDTPRTNHDSGLPPGCTIVDRNPLPAAAGGESDADDANTGKGMAKPLLAPPEQALGVGVVATAGTPPTTGTSSPQQRPAVASGGATWQTHQGLGRTVGTTTTRRVAPAGAQPAVRYNPEPTFRKARGRKKKALLDPSEVTKDTVVGAKELEALLKDATLQQASLKNYLRAVLAIQHGCVRGSIPIWRRAGGERSRQAAVGNSAEAGVGGGMVESKATTGRAALSTCSAQDLARYIFVLDARKRRTCALQAALEGSSGSGGEGENPDDPDQEGSDLMSALMMEVNQRESLLRREGVRQLKRPSALLPPHTVLEHVLSSLQNPDYPTEGAGWEKAWLFSALDHEVSRGPIDFRRDWTDEDDAQPRYLPRESFVAVMQQALPFLASMDSFHMAGEPIFDDDDHRVTFPIRVVADETETAVNWAEMDFRLSKVRDGSHKDCWLMERVVITNSGYDAK
eukprot:g8041.t1